MSEAIFTAYGTPVTYLDTDLNSLGIGAAFLGAEIDNSTARHMLLKAEITLAQVDLTGPDSPAIVIRLVECLDGTNYEDHDDKCYAITIPVADTSAAYKKVSGDIYIPPGKFKLAVVNETGAAFAGTTNILKYVIFTPETSA